LVSGARAEAVMGSWQDGRNHMTPPILLISRDPLLAVAVERVKDNTTRVVQLDEPPEPTTWPVDSASSVVLHIPADHRMSAYEAVRRHHTGRLILILGRDELDKGLPSDAARLTINCPFRVRDLISLLSAPLPTPTPTRWRPGRRAVAATSGTSATKNALPARGLAKGRLTRRTVRAKVTVMLIGIVALLGSCAGLLAGLLQAARDLDSSVRAVHIELGRVGPALNAGNLDAASQAIQHARAALGRADAAAARRSLRIATGMPVLAGPVRDLEHLLGASKEATQAANRAVTIAVWLGPHDGRTLFRNDRFDLKALGHVSTEASRLRRDLADARAELLRVRGSPLAPGIGHAKASGLQQLDSLDRRARQLVEALAVLPAALGADTPRSSLLVMVDPAKLRDSQGMPAAIASVVANRGVLSMEKRPSGSGGLGEKTVNRNPLLTDPWRQQTPGSFLPVGSSLHFPTSGEELLRAYEASSGARAHGVLYVDPMGLRPVLDATGPLRVTGYGLVTADNVARLVAQDAHRRWPDDRTRRRHNDALLATVLRRLLQHGTRPVNLQALGAEAAKRHLHLYARDPSVEAVLAQHPLGGALRAADHDYLAVYTATTSSSHADYAQRRIIHQRVRLAADGTAAVTRIIRIARPVPAGAAQAGAPAGDSRLVVATYLPSRATVTSVRVNGRPGTAVQVREAGRPLVQARIELPQGATTAVEVVYAVPRAAARTAGGLRYELEADPQAMARTAALTVDITAPDGMTIQAARGWTVRGRTASLRVAFLQHVSSHVEVRRA
jgi:Protein of unknown function (DUF4012)